MTREVQPLWRQTDGSLRMNAKWTAKGRKNHRIIMENSRRIAEIRTGSLRRFRAGRTDSKHPLPIARELLDRYLRASRASGSPTSGIPHIQAAAGRPSLATVRIRALS